MPGRDQGEDEGKTPFCEAAAGVNFLRVFALQKGHLEARGQ